jgi:cell division septum initiation protein DivIVA
MLSNNEELIQENSELKQKIHELETKLAETQEHLKKYTAPSRNKKYYETHKEIIKQKIQTANKVSPITSDKRKEYNRIAYLNRKAKSNDLAE